MAIDTDSAIDFFGTQDTLTVGGGTSAVSAGSYSVDGDCVSPDWTNDDDALLCGFVLKFQYPSGTITTGGISLYCQRMNIDSTNDEPLPDSGYMAQYLGTFPTDSNQVAETDNYIPLGPQRLPNLYTSQVYNFFVKNNCGVTMTAGWTIKGTPTTMGPHG